MREYVLETNDFLVSQTDASGNIIFANEDFCRIAGYSLSELVGKPHSIVRHTDMPKAAFKSLWDTVREGRVWSGYVKNRTKEGGYYWVYATVYPSQGLDGSKAYMSCRRKPSLKEIAQAEALYSTLN
jgi:aerotaxis receptor